MAATVQVPLGAVLVLLMGLAYPATADQPAADTEGIPSALRITMHLKEVPREKVYEELGRQAGLSFTTKDPDILAPANWPTPDVSVDLNDRPFWLAVIDIGQITGMKLATVWNRPEIFLTRETGDWGWDSGQPAIVSGAVLIRAASILRRSSLYYNQEARQTDKLEVSLYLQPEPGMQLSAAANPVTLLEAVDDQGGSLIPEKPESSGFGESSGAAGARVMLAYPAGASRKLRKFSGRMALLGITKLQTTEVTNAVAAGEITRQVVGFPASLLVTHEPGRFQVRVIISRGQGTPEQFLKYRDNLQAWAHRIKLVNSFGHEVLITSGGGSLGRDRMELRYELKPPMDWDGPVKLVWSAPTATREVTVPFAFEGLPLP